MVSEIRPQPDVTDRVLAAVRDFLGGPHEDDDGWRFEFGGHLESNWGTVYGGALAAGISAVARAAAPDRSPRSLHLQMIRAVPSGPARAVASVRHAGRTVTTIEVDVFDQRDKLSAVALVTMVNPGAVAARFHDTRTAPPFAIVPVGDGVPAAPWVPPIVEAIAVGYRDADNGLGHIHVVENRHASVDGTPAVANICTVPWDDLETTGPEAACLLADTLVGFPILRTWIPIDSLGPNPDLTLRFTTAPAVRRLIGSSMVLSVQQGTAITGIEVHADDQQLAHGLATSLLLEPAT